MALPRYTEVVVRTILSVMYGTVLMDQLLNTQTNSIDITFTSKMENTIDVMVQPTGYL